ncbi:MAG: GldG family protein [Clostridiales bacterium]|nr:GldG family protein [Clostridiales bacterium]
MEEENKNGDLSDSGNEPEAASGTGRVKSIALRKGAFSITRTLAILAAIVAVNIVAYKYDVKKDMTEKKLYSITDETRRVLSDLTEDVDVYPVYSTGSDDHYIMMFKRIIDEYDKASNRLNVHYTDPATNPRFLNEYAEDGAAPGEGSVIVVSGKRRRVIKVSEILNTQINMQTFQNEISSVSLEPQLTNAVLYVTREYTPKIYAVTGHLEPSLPDALVNELTMAGYETSEFDTLVGGDIPSDCDALIVITPSNDWTAEEADKVSRYLESGGKAAFFLDIREERPENLYGVLEKIGITPDFSYVFESDMNGVFQNNPLQIIPLFAENATAAAVATGVSHVIMPFTQAFSSQDIENEKFIYEPLLMSSQVSYAKTTETLSLPEKQEGDAEGPFNLAITAAAEESGARVVAFGNSFILDESANEVMGGNDYKFIVKAINWAQERKDEVYIGPKELATTPLRLTQAGFLIRAALAIAVLPLGALLFGVVIWLRRKSVG